MSGQSIIEFNVGGQFMVVFFPAAVVDVLRVAGALRPPRLRRLCVCPSPNELETKRTRTFTTVRDRFMKTQSLEVRVLDWRENCKKTGGVYCQIF